MHDEPKRKRERRKPSDLETAIIYALIVVMIVTVIMFLMMQLEASVGNMFVNIPCACLSPP